MLLWMRLILLEKALFVCVLILTRNSTLTQPNIYVRGILFGAMKYELGDHSYVKCKELDLIADIEFRTKGFFTGTYNAVFGTIKRESTGETLFEITGNWNEEMHIKDMVVRDTYQQPTLFLPATNEAGLVWTKKPLL